MEKIKVIIKRSDEAKGHVTAISNTLENLQRTVGGLIEMFRPARDYAIICNEEGKIRSLPVSCSCFGETFVGDIIVVGVDGSEFCDVPGNVVLMWKAGVLFQPVMPASTKYEWKKAWKE